MTLAELWRPQPLFNPLLADPPLSPIEIMAGPFGLVGFAVLVPILRLVALRAPRTAIIGTSLWWMFATLGPSTTLITLAWILTATALIFGLHALRRRTILTPNAMILCVWVGLHILAFPFWWIANPSWYPARTALLHNIGLAYFLLRLIAWGVDWARQPSEPARFLTTLCWLLYPPCMRLGPVMYRHEFFARYDAWNPRQLPDFRAAARRAGWFSLGVIGLAFVGANIPLTANPGIFAHPEAYDTGALVRAFYLIPIQVYLLLWTYNELACTLALLIGIPLENNFNFLPLATSVRDFWRRWHITVGGWLKHYIYIPLGGRHTFIILTYGAVFGYCGLWHGASWSFVAWGATQVIALAVHKWWDQLRESSNWSGPTGRWWTATTWLLTMHYQAATIFLFTDFHFLGLRFFETLATRLFS